MYSILDLNKKLVADLRQIATVLEVKGTEKLKKAELVESILDVQNKQKNGLQNKIVDPQCLERL